MVDAPGKERKCLRSLAGAHRLCSSLTLVPRAYARLSLYELGRHADLFSEQDEYIDANKECR